MTETEDAFPYAIIDTEQKAPAQLFVCHVYGGPKALKHIDLEAALSAESVHRVVKEEIAARLDAYNGQIPTYGRVTGYTICWGEDFAQRFNLAGQLIETLDRAEHLGKLTFVLGDYVPPADEQS
jgi:hypothetical protein